MKNYFRVMDWFLLAIFSLIGAIAIVSMLFIGLSFEGLFAAAGCFLLAFAYSPMIKKTFLVRILLTAITVISIS